ncbi:N-lysine methyltransferase KMT5A [Harmonia axyridis]|uniref:N-lysine methyltransferase KMT5A n=1 Tax=Harmonia axyridis TaxID=115357 RepID=UPI001E2771DF|nr:N-lysine methyltransferase KMT5A [Harmonia axyridis]
MLISESKNLEGKLTVGEFDKNYCSNVKSRRITDFFQPVDNSNADLVDVLQPIRCTRRKAHFLPDPQEPVSDFVKNISDKREDEPVEQDNYPLPVIDEQECAVKSPPLTPHRITLCTETEDLKPDVKMELKSFQKPVIRPKARKKLNANRLNMVEEMAKSVVNRKLTVNNFLPVRKSIRKTKTTVLEEKQKNLEKILRNNIEEGLKICYFDGKGRGIVADKQFKRGDFVIEYSGDLIEISEAKKREEMYATDQNAGCYMYYFEHNNHKYCIDATPESDRLGRLVNHSRNGNLMTKTVSVDGKPRLVLIAKEDIEIGQELLYDYGDRSRESLRYHPWLAY